MLPRIIKPIITFIKEWCVVFIILFFSVVAAWLLQRSEEWFFIVILVGFIVVDDVNIRMYNKRQQRIKKEQNVEK